MSDGSNFGTTNLPTREAVAEAWVGFKAHYPKYLDESNRDQWFMQDKIVHDYMTGRLVVKEDDDE